MAWRWLVSTAVLLSGCAAAPPDSSSLAPEPAPDCSFRAATTCWTLGARVPTPARESRDTAPDRLLKQPPAVLASRGDTVAAP
jgi:hypothetical protein